MGHWGGLALSWHAVQPVRTPSLLPGDHCGKVNDNEALISAAVWSPLSYSSGSKEDLQSEVAAEWWICSESKLGILLFLKAKAKMPIFSQILLLDPFTFYSLKLILRKLWSYSHIDCALGVELCFNFTVNCSADLTKHDWKPLHYPLMSYHFLIHSVKNASDINHVFFLPSMIIAQLEITWKTAVLRTSLVKQCEIFLTAKYFTTESGRVCTGTKIQMKFRGFYGKIHRKLIWTTEKN